MTGEAPPPSGSTPELARSPHEHRSVRADGRVWLEALPDEAATMRLHAFCADCGAVRHRLTRRGRPMGYFAQAVANLKVDLEHEPKLAKLAQVQVHLILKTLEAVPDFDDPYSMDFETQRRIFLRAVQRFRPDIDADLVDQVLPREPRRRRPAYIDLIASSQGGTVAPGSGTPELLRTGSRP